MYIAQGVALTFLTHMRGWQVRLVKSRGNGEICAMKSMIKEAMVRKNQVGLHCPLLCKDRKGGSVS